MRERVPIDKINLIRQQYDQGMTLVKLGRMFNCSPEWARQLLKKSDGYISRPKLAKQQRELAINEADNEKV